MKSNKKAAHSFDANLGNQITMLTTSYPADDVAEAFGVPLSQLAIGFCSSRVGYAAHTQPISRLPHPPDFGKCGRAMKVTPARSVAGMISAVGLPTTPTFTDELVETAFNAYRDKLNRQKILATLKDYNKEIPSIKMVGVWDTVGSLGIPAIFGGVDPIVYGFLDRSLSPLVQHAFHALAIDEKRMQFQPTLWDSTPVAGQVVEQVWFTGCHSNVGGGCREVTPGQDSLSDITLGWMITRALPLGLAFDQAVLNQYKLPIQPKYSLEPIYESWTVLNGLPFFRKVGKNAMLANSVSVRVKLDPNYRPKPLTITKTGLSKQYTLAEVVPE